MNEGMLLQMFRASKPCIGIICKHPTVRESVFENLKKVLGDDVIEKAVRRQNSYTIELTSGAEYQILPAYENIRGKRFDKIFVLGNDIIPEIIYCLEKPHIFYCGDEDI